MFVVFVFTYCFVGIVITHNDEDKFLDFVKKYGKLYVYGSEEYGRRLKIFRENLRIQEELNHKRPNNSSALYGVTKFSDLSSEEFREKYLSSYTPNKEAFQIPVLQVSPQSKSNQLYYDQVYMLQQGLPKRVDWRTKKGKSCVTAVRNQKLCGACWAFSIVEAMESQACIQNDQLPSLSIQEVIDCSYGYKNLAGCKGGDICYALRWLEDNKRGLVTESEYPLTDTLGKCKGKFNHSKGVEVKSYTCQQLVGKESVLMAQLVDHPVAVSIDAYSWNNYLGGIIQYHCGYDSNNHAVEIVGYDTTGEIPYYIIKNSWGSDFGIDGYVHIAIGNNVCGLAQEVASVEVTV